MKFYDVTTWSTIHIMPNISRTKGKKAITFAQLIEHNSGNIFLEESYTKCGAETIPRPFLKNQNRAYLWVNILKFYIFRFDYLASFFSFYKNKKRSGTSLPASFSAWFLKKNISLVIFFYQTESQCLVAFPLWDIGL